MAGVAQPGQVWPQATARFTGRRYTGTGNSQLPQNFWLCGLQVLGTTSSVPEQQIPYSHREVRAQIPKTQSENPSGEDPKPRAGVHCSRSPRLIRTSCPKFEVFGDSSLP